MAPCGVLPPESAGCRIMIERGLLSIYLPQNGFVNTLPVTAIEFKRLMAVLNRGHAVGVKRQSCIYRECQKYVPMNGTYFYYNPLCRNSFFGTLIWQAV